MKQMIEVPISVKNCALFCSQMLQNIAEDIELCFGAGEYHFWPEEAQIRSFAISNTDTTLDMQQKVGLLLEGKKGLHITGKDTIFIFHGCQMAIGIRDCKDICISGITIQYSCPSAVDVTILQSNKCEVIASYPSPYRCNVEKNKVMWHGEDSDVTGKPYWSLSGDMDITQIYHPHEERVCRTNQTLFLGSTNVETMPDNKLKIQYENARDINVGDVFQMRRTLRETCGVFIGNSKNITFENMKISYLYAMGIVSQCSENLVFRQVAFRCVEKDRYSASGADFLQFSGCSGHICVEKCEFVNPHDDPINVHGTFLEITRIGERRGLLRYCHSQTKGFRSVFEGDCLELFDRKSLLPEGELYKVLEVIGPNPSTPELMEVLLDKELPQVGGLVAENISWIPEVTIRDSVFYKCPTRGILLTTRGKSVIEHNLFSCIEMAAISISCDAEEWFESGVVHDVTIRSNRFERCKEQALLVCPTNKVDCDTKKVHSNIRFIGNQLKRMPMPAVYFKSVFDAVESDNICIDNEDGEFAIYDSSNKKAVDEYCFAPNAPNVPIEIKGFGSDKFKINNRYLTKNGKPWLPVSGELHYSRLPRHAWAAELDKMKQAGLDIVSTYIFWIHHEEIEGQFRWDGNLDLGHFIDLCHERGLGVALRMGPWAHGECRNGGHPDWLIKKCEGSLRRNAEPYLTLVKEYFLGIVKHLAGRELFSVQIENELVDNEEHLETLYHLARECGLNAPFFTATGWGHDMSKLRHLILPTFGGYAEQPWNQNTLPSTPNPHFFFTGIRSDGMIGNDLLLLKEVEQDDSIPYLTCEIGPGVQCCSHRRPIISTEDVLSMVITTVGDGCNWLGMYMFHGGSNPIGQLSTMQESTESGYPNDCPVISYDFQAPIGECGRLRDSYYRLQSFHSFINEFGDLLAPMIPFFPNRRPIGLLDMETFRCCIRSDGHSAFLFVNNHHHGKQLPEHNSVCINIAFEDGQTEVIIPSIPTDSSFVFPVRMQLSEGLTLEYALAQPITRSKDSYLFEAVDGIPPVFKFSDGSTHIITDTKIIGGITFNVRNRINAQKQIGNSLKIIKNSPNEWKLEGLPEGECIIEAAFYGNRATAYRDGKLIGDQYYYGDKWQFNVPKGESDVTVQITTLYPDDDIYFECERKNGADLENAIYF